MLMRIRGGMDGIREYLEEGRKSGREFSRDELDNRLPLAGDLDFTDNVIQSMQKEGDKYLHITLSFKEDEISADTLRAITADFEQFAFSAYDSDEYAFYAEAHLPRQQSYVHAQTGELIERKPHIHIVIPQTNLLTGQGLNPFGRVEHQTAFLEAFQEHINAKYGLASPQDNRRSFLTPESELISRYKGDQFKGAGADLKAEILDTMLARDVRTMADFDKLLAERGDIRTRNAGKPGEYRNLKEPGAAKGVNLKDHVFSREFIELPTAEKKALLSRAAANEYASAGQARPTPADYESRLHDWRERRALEIKHMNSGSKAYKAYKDASPADQLKILADRKAAFYQKWREPDVPLEVKERPALPDQSVINTLRLAGKLEFDEPPAHGAKTLGELRSLSDVPKFSDIRTFSQVDVVKHQKEGEALQEPEPAKYANSVIDRFSNDLHEKRQARKNEMTLIKRELDAGRLLDQLSRTHGVIPEKYLITQGKDGGDRIRCGTRNLNVSDFLTQELNLPWKDADRILRDCYDRQKGKEPSQRQTRPHRELWQRYQSARPALQQQRQQAWNQQLDSEKKRRAKLKADFVAARSKIEGNRAMKPAERKAAVSLARVQRIAAEVALREEIKLERNALKEAYPNAGSAQYSLWLRQQAQNGDTVALDELRKRESHAKVDPVEPAKGELHSDAVTQPTPFMPFKYEISYRGDVTYTDRQGKMLRDSSDRVSVLRTDEQAVLISLKLAQQKFYKGGDFTELDVGGSAEFKRMAVEIAVNQGVNVKFTDKGMETLRQQLLKEKQQAREHEKQKKPKAQPEQQKTTKEAEKQRIVERERAKARKKDQDRGL